jgi:hypothetical protein
MAEKRVIELEVKTDKANKAINDLTKSNTDLAASFEDVYGEMQPLSGRMGELEDRLYELALAGKQNTQEYKDLQSEIAKFKKVIAETDASVDGASGTMSQKLGGALGGITSGFELAQGAMGAFGAESEEVQAALLKVQSAMAISQGVQGIKEAIPSFKALGTAASDALKGIRTGIAATGIGLLVVAVGALVAYWDDIKEAVSGVSSEQEALNEKTEANLKISEEKVAALDKQDNILKLQGKTEKQILQYKIAELDTAIKIAEVNIQNQKVTKVAQIEASKRNKDILVGILDFLTSPINVLLKTIDKIASVVGIDSQLVKGFDAIKSAAANIVFDPAETAKEGDLLIKAAEERFIELKNQKAGYELQIQAIDKAAADARRQAQKEANDKRVAAEKEANDKLKKLAEDKAKFDLEQIELDEIRQEQAYQRKLDAAAKAAEEEKAQEEKFKAEQLAAEEADERRQEAARDRRLEGEAKLQELKYAAVLQGLTLISDLSEVFAKKGEKQAKRAFEIQKAASIAAAVITTYQSAVSAYQSQFLPLPDPTSPIRGAIAAGIAVASGLGNVAKIASQKFEGSGSISASAAPSGGGGGGGGSVITPNFNIVGNAQATNPLAGLGGQPLQAYVVSGDVTTAQSLDRNRINYATFG